MEELDQFFNISLDLLCIAKTDGYFLRLNPRWAVLGSLGWHQWSRFGKVDDGVDSSNPTSLSTDLDYDDRWHTALMYELAANIPLMKAAQ